MIRGILKSIWSIFIKGYGMIRGILKSIWSIFINVSVPFTVIPKKVSNVICWAIFIIFFSNLGIILSIFDAINKGEKILPIMVKQLDSGALYLGGISLLASYIGSIFIDFFNQNKDTKFIYYKIISLIGSATLICLMSANYSSINNIQNLSPAANIIQFILYALSVANALYSFCISCMELKDQYESYAQTVDRQRDSKVDSANNLNDDGEGNVLD